MLFSNDSNYLVAYSEKYDGFTNCRIDRMEAVEMKKEDRAESNQITEFDVNQYRKQSFGMFAGEAQEVALEFDKPLIDIIFNKFGEKTTITRIGETVKVIPSQQFYGFILWNQITAPEGIKQGLRDFVKGIETHYLINKSKGAVLMKLEEDILNKIVSILSKREVKKRRNQDNFNVFSILGMERKEVQTHSAVLYSLLSVDGAHNLGDYFLRKFVEIVLKINADVDCELYALREVAFDDSRIDLIVKINNDEFGIEIKIDAGEQPQQLQRYYDLTNNPVYYLTLEGKAPISCNEEVLDKIICISFKNEIINWLSECKKELSNPLDVIINQYINLLQKLTKQDKEDKEIMQYIKGRQSFEAVNELIKAQTNYKTRFLTEFFHRLQKELNFSQFCFSSQCWDESFKGYYSSKATYPQLWFELKCDRDRLDLDDNHSLFFYIEVSANLYTFVAIREKSGNLIQDFPKKYNKLIHLFKSANHCQSDEEKYKFNYFWKYVHVNRKKLNFKNQSELYCELLAKDNEDDYLFEDEMFNRIKYEIIQNFEEARKFLKEYLM